MNRTARAVLLALLALAPAAPAPARGPVPAAPLLLRFLPQATPLTYKTREVTVHVEMHGGHPAKTRKTELARTLYRHVKPGAAGNLALTLETLGLTESVDGQPLDSRAATPPSTSEMSPRGLLRLPGGTFGLPTPLTLLLPEAPLPAPMELFGQKRLQETSWTTESGPTREVPIPVRTIHKITGIELFGGRACVVIELAARDAAKLDQGKRLFEYFARRRVLFDPVAGHIADSSSEERADDAVLPPPSTGLQRKRWETLGTSRLVP